MSTVRTSNTKARKLVDGLTEFKGSNTFAEFSACTETRPTNLYVVYSYGYHFPMYIAEWFDNQAPQWYENQDKYSQSTSRQQGQCRPSAPTTKMTTEQMKVLATDGIVGVAMMREKQDLTRDAVEQYILNMKAGGLLTPTMQR